MDLTEEQWSVLKPLIPAPKRRADGRGRLWKDTREALNGVLWILRTGAPWQDMPDRYPPYQTCHRRFQQWVRAGVLLRLLQRGKGTKPMAMADRSGFPLAAYVAGASLHETQLTYDFKYDMLQIDFDPREGKFLFEFFEDPYRPIRWKKQCPTNEGYSAFIHFLKLKQWFPVQEIPRGS